MIGEVVVLFTFVAEVLRDVGVQQSDCDHSRRSPEDLQEKKKKSGEFYRRRPRSRWERQAHSLPMEKKGVLMRGWAPMVSQDSETTTEMAKNYLIETML